MSNEDKILEFNMGGFILKLVFSIGICVLLLKVTASERLLYNILSGTVYFLLGYTIATIFGFALRTTGNYILAGILFIIAFFALAKGAEMLSALGTVGEILTMICAFIVFVWPPISDVRKLILYIKYVI